MKKVKSLRKHRIDVHPYKQAAELPPAETTLDSNKQFSLSRGQRRRAEKNERVQIKLGNAPVPSFKKPSKQKASESSKATLMLSELEESLRASASNSEDIKPAANVVVTSNKMKHQIAVREAARFFLI